MNDNSFPQPHYHRASGQARLKLNGTHIYLGKWGTAHAQAAYDRTIETWLANGRRWSPQAAHAATAPPTLEALATLYLAFAKGYFQKAGKPTSTAAHVTRAIELLTYAKAPEPPHTPLAKLPPGSITPRHILAFQRYLAADPQQRWGVKSINYFTSLIVGMFRWAAAEELIATDWQALKAVRPLKRGRAPAPGIPAPRGSEPIQPVLEAHLAATLEHAHPMLAAMIRLQLATAMRPTELLHLRPSDLAPTQTPGVTAYTVRPDGNKLDHKDLARVVYIGPRGLAILKDWLPTSPTAPHTPDAFIFSPAKARAYWLAMIPASRRRKPIGKHQRTYADRYTTDEYRRAIWKACARANRAQRLKGKDRWRWSPNQLRHSAATFIARHESLDVARILLGHQHVTTTLIYAAPDRAAAAAAALRIA